MVSANCGSRIIPSSEPALAPGVRKRKRTGAFAFVGKSGLAITGANCASDAISGWPTSLSCESAGSSPSDGGSGLSSFVNGSPARLASTSDVTIAKLGIDNPPLDLVLGRLARALNLNRQRQQQEQKEVQEDAHAP